MTSGYHTQMVLLCGILVVLSTLFAGCITPTTNPQSRVTTGIPAVPSAPVQTPEVPAQVTTVIPVVTPVTETTRAQLSDTGFLLAYESSQARVLGLLTDIHSEILKNGINRSSLPEYTALGSYGRQLNEVINEEVQAMEKFREFSDPADEALKERYITYLSAMKPFAGNIEAGGGLAQKRQLVVAKRYFNNAKNDLGVVRNVPIPEQRVLINQIREDLVPFMDVIQEQADIPLKNL